MNTAEIEIKPSPKARRLFNTLIARADNKTKVLSLEDALKVSTERASDDSQDSHLISDLKASKWIDTMPDGSIKILL